MTLDEAKDGERPTIRATESPDTILARQLLAAVIATLPRLRSATDSAEVIAVLSRSAENALASRPGDAGWTTIAQSLLRLRDDVSAGGAQARVQADARTVVQSLLQRVRRNAAVVREDATDRLESAWADEARRR